MTNPAAEVERPRRRPRSFLVILAVPLMLVGGFAAYTAGTSLINPVAMAPASVALSYASPVKQAALVGGKLALQQAIANPAYAGFAHSYVVVSSGQVATLCGTIMGTSGYHSLSGRERFVAISGNPVASLQAQDPSFNVLWTRVCARPQGAAVAMATAGSGVVSYQPPPSAL